MRDLLMGDVTLVGIIASNVPQVMPQLPQALLESRADHMRFSAKT